MAERSAKQLGLSKADLPNSVIEVIATLSKSGFDAYIVGGGVRDTLLGLSPKDFDAVTDAKPHEVKDIFGKRCRIIGRRFQLAHVYSGRDMIEVATFRAPPNGDAHTTSDGMIVRDNVWGDIQQDFARRDFSINAMYYEPIKGIVHDFCNALDDIKHKIIRLLGHAPLRIEEDPVRLLRALRFKAKLGFDFDKALSKQFHNENWALLDQVSPHRLYDESQKMFTGGYLVPLLPLLFEYGAIKHLIIYPPKKPTLLVTQVATNTDKRIAIGKSINPAFFYAALLWDNYLYQLAKFKKKNMPFHDAQLQAASKVIDRQRIKTAIPRFAEQFIRDIWVMQPKLANPKVRQIPQLAEHARFRAAYDFLLLREQCDDASNPLSESTNGMGEWWQTYQTLSEKQKRMAMDDFTSDTRRSPNKSSRNRKGRRLETDINTNLDTLTSSDSDNTVELHAKDHYSNGSASTNPNHKGTGASKQHNHYAKERAQLQRLSLGHLLETSSLQSEQPNPLFTIDAKKIARQVPKQLNVNDIVKTKQIAAVSNEHAKKSNEKKRLEQELSNLVNGSQSTQNESRKLDNNSESPSSKGSVKSDVVALPRSQTVPAKRRRRLPTQQLSQAEIIQSNKQVDSQPSKPELHNASNTKASKSNVPVMNELDARTNAPVTNSAPSQANDNQAIKKPTKPSKAKQMSNSSSSALQTNGIVSKAERVPAKRRRRPPSSNQSVSERLS